MSWNWSHTQEAYENARRNLEKFERSDLLIIVGEIAANMGTGEDEVFSTKKYRSARAKARFLSEEALRLEIWSFMEHQAICDNGGHNAWCCPYGCHTVSFEDETAEQATIAH